MENGLGNYSLWKYYNHAVVYDGDPRSMRKIDGTIIKSLLKKHPKAFFVRYTTDFDAKPNGNWWYCIKDDVFDFEELKSKKKNVIRNAKKNFIVCKVNPSEHEDAFFEITNDAFLGYETPLTFSKQQIEHKCKFLAESKTAKIYGAFDTQTQKMEGYLWVDDQGDWISLIEQKVLREGERKQINAALVCAVCEDNNERLKKGLIISDGQRNILHKTNFQEYLIKYFGFRKAYCTLNVDYRSIAKIAVWLLFPFEKIIERVATSTNIGVLKNISAVLKMERIMRRQENE